jgi:hypothetical protein
MHAPNSGDTEMGSGIMVTLRVQVARDYHTSALYVTLIVVTRCCMSTIHTVVVSHPRRCFIMCHAALKDVVVTCLTWDSCPVHVVSVQYLIEKP